MNLAQALRFSRRSTIAFAGAGGKSTAMFQLAHQISQPAIVTATTHLGVWQIPLADLHMIANSEEDVIRFEPRGVTLVTGEIKNERTKPVEKTVLSRLREVCKKESIPLFIEADGSRQKPLKAPAEHEPAIPEFVDQVIYVAGLSGLGKPLTEENIHRSEIFSRLSGLNISEAITPESIIRVVSHPEGGLKNIPPQAKCMLLLNQADTPELQSIGGKMSQPLLNNYESVIVGSLQNPNLQTFDRVAGIILAAGESKRFGQPKQLLDWRGQPFIRVVAQTALAAGLSPVIIVTGSNAVEIENAVKSLNVKIIRNEEWSKGQSTSIKAGVGAMPTNIGASIFLLTDQPQIGTDIIRALMEVHTRDLPPIIAPLVMEEQRANPVLFDKITFPDLLQLEGDIGGRAIFNKYKVEYLPWHDDRLLLDVDKPEDYQRLISDETL